ncbi:MAG: hypothetical protein FJZ47_03335 [Candidatus Tectomicrobia bacterium]|uniref:Uncharacterized protein n=1 Tax=Tectimicrobiota bacterium TaxID=2528274 RepID=A0A938B2I4_UNCTE|nr:hypothetical protein [Candidatus Tectomicrobia bacterium]
MLSMHSVRAMVGSHAPAALTQVCTTFLSPADASASPHDPVPERLCSTAPPGQRLEWGTPWQ